MHPNSSNFLIIAFFIATSPDLITFLGSYTDLSFSKNSLTSCVQAICNSVLMFNLQIPHSIAFFICSSGIPYIIHVHYLEQELKNQFLYFSFFPHLQLSHTSIR